MLACLIMHRGSDVARERLIETFWPEVDAERARDSLKTTLWAIRRTLRSAQLDPDEFVTSTKAVVRWEANTALDAQRFLDLVAADDRKARSKHVSFIAAIFSKEITTSGRARNASDSPRRMSAC